MVSTSEIVLKLDASDFLTADIIEGIRAIVREEIQKERYMTDRGGTMPEGVK